MRADSSRRPPQKSHALLVLVCLVTMAAGVGVILECRGPFRGWIGRARLRLAAPRPQPAAAPATNETERATPGAAEEPPAPPAPAAAALPAKPDLHARYEELYAACLARAPRPEVGKVCQFLLRSGEQIRGRLVRAEPTRITLGVEHGTMSYPMSAISYKDVLRLFPETAARVQALAMLRRETTADSPPEQADAPAAPEPAPVAPTTATTPAPPAGEPPPAAPEEPEPVGGVWRHDPSPAPTPDTLKPTLAAFAEWLNTQHRRVGGRIAEKVYAKRQSGKAVLYLRMDPAFMAQDYGTRYQIAEGMQIFWALRCQGDGVVGMGSAYVVLLDQDNRVVGGSRPGAPTDIWLEDK